MGSDATDAVARELAEAGYDGLFLSGERSSVDAVWRGGENRAALAEIVQGEAYGDLPRALASEVLFRKAPGDVREYSGDTLGRVYAHALALTGLADRPMQFSGNEWGFMYHADEHGGDAYGALGPHLLEAGPAAVPHLAELLGDAREILYVGSQDATLGNRLAYRIKDVAAYYIGKIAGIPVQFHDEPAKRDAEIDRLRAALGDRR
jgi:hypothetical protein